MLITFPLSALHQAYLPIVAGAERASTLHYCCGNEKFAWGPLENGVIDHDLTHAHAHSGRRLVPQVLLLDAGCEWMNYASDSWFHLRRLVCPF